MTERKGYYDLHLKNQSKKTMGKVSLGLSSCNGEVTDSHSENYFSGKQQWRNPLTLKIKIAPLDRFKFTKITGLWLHRPPKIGIIPCTPRYGSSGRHIPLRGDHDNARDKMVRTYRINNCGKTYPFPLQIWEMRNGGRVTLVEGGELVGRVLNGEMELLR